MQWNNYRYKIVNNEIILTKYEGEETDVCIPETIDGCPVAEIGEDAFAEYGAAIERIEVPKTVRKIGDGAFKMCMSLAELILQEGLEQIGEDVFLLTPLTRISLPSTVSFIGKIWELGEIEWCVDANSPYFFSDGYALYRKSARQYQDTRLPDAPDQEGRAEAECELSVIFLKDSRREYHIAEGTTSIGRGAFAGQNALKSVWFPASLRIVGEDAFESCQNLEHVFFNEGLEEIHADAFGHCVNLRRVCLPASLRVMKEHALTNTFGWSDAVNGISEVTVAEGNPYFWADKRALYEKRKDGTVWLVKYFGKERKFVVPSEVFGIDQSAFRRAGLKQIEISESVKFVGTDAFRECKNMETLILPTGRGRETSDLCGDPGCSEGDAVRVTSMSLYVPRTPVYRKDEVMRLLEGEGFDLAGYDRLFETYLELSEQCGMACCRLKYPVLLRPETENAYREFFQKNLEELLVGICEREDMERLADLAELEIFDAENIDDCVDIVNQSGRTKLLSYLMEYKQEQFGATAFDFSL